MEAIQLILASCTTNNKIKGISHQLGQPTSHIRTYSRQVMTLNHSKQSYSNLHSSPSPVCTPHPTLPPMMSLKLTSFRIKLTSFIVQTQMILIQMKNKICSSQMAPTTSKATQVKSKSKHPTVTNNSEAKRQQQRIIITLMLNLVRIAMRAT